MRIPFTVEQFFDTFGAYNTAIWPVQILAYILGVSAILLALRENILYDRIICGILAFFWIWMEVFYHIVHFSLINPAAWIFGVLFIVQGLLFFITGTIYERLSFRFVLKPPSIIGACFILYAMVIYPLVGISLGHAYPRTPVFGVAPCSATIFTFGMLLWSAKSVPGYLIIIPLLWSFVGMSAAISLGVPQDYGLVFAGVLGSGLIMLENRKRKESQTA